VSVTAVLVVGVAGVEKPQLKVVPFWMKGSGEGICWEIRVEAIDSKDLHPFWMPRTVITSFPR
jgi:hypothetical protein